MSVMTQLQDASTSQEMNSSADANPHAPYPSEPRDSTRAIRNDSSSSMTAIRDSLNALRPFPGFGIRRIVADHYSGRLRRRQELYAGVRLAPGVDHLRHPDQVRQGLDAHFAHDRTAMNFDGDLAKSEVARHLLVHLPGRDQEHDLLLARRQGPKPLSNIRNLPVEGAPLPV